MVLGCNAFDAVLPQDGRPEDKPTHLVFGSDSESETGETNAGEHSHLVARPVNVSVQDVHVASLYFCRSVFASTYQDLHSPARFSLISMGGHDETQGSPVYHTQ